MNTEVQTTDPNAELIERVVMMGDLSRLTAEQRIAYYRAVCESAGLNPLTQPFQYLTLNGKLVLYAGKNAAEQIRQNRGISVTRLEREQTETTFDVTAYGQDITGRMDAALGSVSIKGLTGESLSNAKMKAETKAKRRLTLSLSGLGFLDETEVGSIPGAARVDVDLETGEILSDQQTEVRTLRMAAQEASEAAEAPQVEPDSLPLFDEAPGASVGAGGLSEKELAGLIKTTGISREVVAATARRIFPGIKSSSALDDDQREQLWDVIAIEAAEREGDGA